MDSFYKGKCVLVTGHTGFKGAWMCQVLVKLGAKVVGYSLEPPTKPSLFELSGIESKITSVIADIRDYDCLLQTIYHYKPEIVIHMAAQPLVGVGYENPRMTYQVNVMGTVNLLEAVRVSGLVKSVVNVTTDKVYLNNEWCWGYRESERLEGYDPYSNSKSCSELVTHCYSRCFPRESLAISTVRAGNVIGGGDFTNPRLIPDCMRAALSNDVVRIRNPKSTRPYQHVLEPVVAYLLIAMKQYQDASFSSSYNVGPEDHSCVTNETLVKMFCQTWGSLSYEIVGNGNSPHEANYLKLDISKIKSVFGWRPVWDVQVAIGKTIEWIKAYRDGEDLSILMNAQIDDYFNECVDIL